MILGLKVRVERIATAASDNAFLVLGMDSVFHDFQLDQKVHWKSSKTILRFRVKKGDDRLFDFLVRTDC